MGFLNDEFDGLNKRSFKQPKLDKDKELDDPNNTDGYQLAEKHVLIERKKKIELGYRDWITMMYLYDFKMQIVTNITSSPTNSTHSTVPFRDLSQEALHEAYDILVKLGGEPPPAESIFGKNNHAVLKNDLVSAKKIAFKKGDDTHAAP